MLPVMLVIFFAIFVQGLVGFGLALIAMPLLAALIGIGEAAPAVALLGFTAEIALVWRYRRDLNVRTVGRLVVAAALGIPLGLLALRGLDEQLVLTVLGLVIVGYAGYALLNLRVPALSHPAWGYGLGFLAGVLGGAYNTSGPPVIIYGHCRRWSPEEFKGNLQGFFVAVSLFIAAGHLLAGNVTGEVWRIYLLGLAPMALALWLGPHLATHVNPFVFRRLVLLLLLVLGISLILG